MGFLSLQAIKDDLSDDSGAFINTFDSCRQSVFCFQVKITLLILYMWRILHGKCWRTVFTHELLTYQKSKE